MNLVIIEKLWVDYCPRKMVTMSQLTADTRVESCQIWKTRASLLLTLTSKYTTIQTIALCDEQHLCGVCSQSFNGRRLLLAFLEILTLFFANEKSTHWVNFRSLRRRRVTLNHFLIWNVTWRAGDPAYLICYKLRDWLKSISDCSWKFLCVVLRNLNDSETIDCTREMRSSNQRLSPSSIFGKSHTMQILYTADVNIDLESSL